MPTKTVLIVLHVLIVAYIAVSTLDKGLDTVQNYRATQIANLDALDYLDEHARP